MLVDQFTSQFENIEIPNLGYIRIPALPISSDEKQNLHLKEDISNEDFLYALAKRGFNEKLKKSLIPKDRKKEYAERLRLEFDTIKSLYFTNYILLVYRIIQFCNQNHILNSPARGSCGGSLLLYVLGVIKIDPIKYDLLFERFISAARTEIREINGEKYLKSDCLPDVDIDCDRALKYKVNDYIDSIFPNRTASIITFNIFQSKSLVKEVLKCLEGYSEEDAKHTSNLIESKFGKVDSLSDTLSKNIEFKEWSDKHTLSFSVCQKIQGLIRNKSVHASGIIICDEILSECMPTELTSNKKIVTSYDMDYAQLVGIKIDNLGLKNLSAIKHCLDLVHKNIEDIDIEDPSIYQFLNLHNDYYYGIFQIEEGLGKQVTRKIKPINSDDLVVSIAIGRPGSLNFLEEYLKFRDSGEKREIDPRVDDILAPTGNIIIFQEQIMALCGRMAGFNPQERDGVRKSVGKKLVEKMKSYKEKFISQSIENKYQEDFVNSIWDTFERSGNYLFNRSHARGYSNLTAITTYLKANHMLEYFLCLLIASKDEQDPTKEVSIIQKEMHHFGIKLLPPNLIKSQMDFTIEGNDIRFGLSCIKGISEKTMEKVYHFNKNATNKFEVFESASEAGLSIGHLSSFIQAGLFDPISNNRAHMVYEAQLWNLLKGKDNREKKYILNYAKNYGNNISHTLEALATTIKDEKGKPIIKPSRLATIKKYAEKYKIIYKQNTICQDYTNFFYENMLLGFTSGKKLIDIFIKDWKSLQPIAVVKEQLSKTLCDFIGVVDEVKTAKSKAGTPYASFQISDETGVIKTMIFGKGEKHKDDDNYLDKLEICKSHNNGLPKEGDVVIVIGQKMDDDCVFANRIEGQRNKIYTRLSDIKSRELSTID